MQWARDCKGVCLGEGTVPGFEQTAHLFLCYFNLWKNSFYNKAIVPSELSTTALSVFAVNLQRNNFRGKSVCCFQEQLTSTGFCWQRAFLSLGRDPSY